MDAFAFAISALDWARMPISSSICLRSSILRPIPPLVCSVIALGVTAMASQGPGSVGRAESCRRQGSSALRTLDRGLSVCKSALRLGRLVLESSWAPTPPTHPSPGCSIDIYILSCKCTEHIETLGVACNQYVALKA